MQFLLAWLCLTIATSVEGGASTFFFFLFVFFFAWLMLKIEFSSGDGPNYPKKMSTDYGTVDLARWNTSGNTMTDPDSGVTLEQTMGGDWVLSDDESHSGYSDYYGSYHINS